MDTVFLGQAVGDVSVLRQQLCEYSQLFDRVIHRVFACHKEGCVYSIGDSGSYLEIEQAVLPRGSGRLALYAFGREGVNATICRALQQAR